MKLTCAENLNFFPTCKQHRHYNRNIAKWFGIKALWIGNWNGSINLYQHPAVFIISGINLSQGSPIFNFWLEWKWCWEGKKYKCVQQIVLLFINNSIVQLTKHLSVKKNKTKKTHKKKNILTLQTLWNSFKKRELWKLWDLGHLYRACHCKVYSLSHSLVFICIKFNMASGLLCNVMCKIYFSWKDHPTNSTKSKVYLYIYYEHKAASHTAQKLAVQLSLTFNDA